MKKILSFLLCLCMILPLSSCFYVRQEHDRGDESFTDINDTDPSYPEDSKKPEKETNGDSDTEKTPQQNPTNVVTRRRYYYKTEDSKTGKAKYSIYDINGNLAFTDETYDPPEIYELGKYGLALRYPDESNGKVYQFYDAESNLFSEKYTSVIKYSDTVVIYLDGTYDNCKLVAKSLFDNSIYKEYKLDFAKKENPISSFALSENKLYLSYQKSSGGVSSLLLSLFDMEYDYFTDYHSLNQLAQEINYAIDYDQDPHTLCNVLGITNTQHREWFQALFTSMRENDLIAKRYNTGIGYDTKDLNGDGVSELLWLTGEHHIVAIFTMVDGKPFLLDHYGEKKSGYVNHLGEIYVKEGSETDAICSVYRIADNNTSLELIEQFPTLGYPNTSMSEQCARLREQSFSNDWEIRQICAQQAFLSVLKNEIKVYNTQTREYCYLSDCKLPSTNTPLSKAEGLRYALADLDHDAVKELIIDGGDRLVLRYDHGTIYLYPSVLQNMYQLNTNGSYNWRCEDQDAAHGASRLSFDGTNVSEKVLWRIVNDGKPNAEYYTEGWQVTQAELTRYREVHSVTPIEYGSLSLPFQVNISPQKALKIANTYWGDPVGRSDAACGTKLTYQVALQEEPYYTVGYYHVVLLCEHSSSHEGSGTVHYVTDIRHLFVDMRTGECLTYVIQNGK